MTRLVTIDRASQALAGYTNAPGAPPHDASSAGDLWRILKRSRFLIAATVLAIFVATLAYCFLTPPLYSVSSEILIDPRDRQVVVNNVNPSGVAPDGGITQVESESLVVRSSSVLLHAIAATNLTDDPEFNGSGIWAWLSTSFPFLNEATWFTKLVRGSSDVRSEAWVLAATLKALKGRLAVKRAEKVFVLEVVVTAHTPDKAARLSNAISDAYLQDQAETKAHAAERASAALTAQLDEQRARVVAIETKIEIYKATNGIVTANGQLIGDQKLADISNLLTAAQGLTASLRAKVDNIERLRQSRTGADATAEALGSTVVSKLREQEGTLAQRQADLEARFGPQYPSIVSIRQQLAEVRQLITAELNRISAAERANYERSLANEHLLSVQVNQAKSATRTVAQASVRLREMERNLEANRAVYVAFLVRAQETRQQAYIDTTNARIITRAMPPTSKSWPPRALLLAGAICSGLGLGSGLALIREYLKPTIFSRAQIEAITGAPVIGILPASVLVRRRGKLGRSEAMTAPIKPRVLATAGLVLRYLFDAEPTARETPTVRSLMITSGAQDNALRREVCQLFTSAARVRGDRVLVVDANVAGGEPSTCDGLLEILHGRCSLHAIVDLAPSNGVAVLGKGHDRSGINNENWNGAMRMLAEARHHFDLAIIDGGVLAENLPVAPLLVGVHEMLLVGQLARTSQNEVMRAADAVNIMGRHISAIVLVDPMAPVDKQAVTWKG